MLRGFTILWFLSMSLWATGQICSEDGIIPYQPIEAGYADYISDNTPITNKTIPLVLHVISAQDYQSSTLLPTIATINSMLSDSPSCGLQYDSPPSIELCLAQQNICGNLSQGIYPYDSDLSTFDPCTQEIALKTLPRIDDDPYPTYHYLNIYLVDEICTSCETFGCAAAGYSTMPQDMGKVTDGMVIEIDDWLGDCNDRKNIIHELGHYLGLYHTFDGGCKNDNCLVDGDKVCDTPPEYLPLAYADHPCLTGSPENSCSSDVNSTDINNPFTSDQLDGDDNIMNYTPVSCTNTFTSGQVSRMHYILDEIRIGLDSESSCSPPCDQSITWDVSADYIEVNPNEAFSIINSTTANSFVWHVENEEITTKNLIYAFDNEGSYTIILEAITDNSECSAQYAIIVDVVCNILIPNILVTNDTPEIGDGIELSVTNSDSDLTYTWYDGHGSLLGMGETTNYSVGQSGHQVISLQICSDNCCTTLYTHLQVGDCPSEHDGTLWIFGSDGIVLNFGSGVPVEEDNVFFGDFITDFHSDEPSIIELDAQGNLLFYSDNDNIFNKNYEIMDNGNPLKGSQTTSQMISLRQPGSSSIYYVFMPEALKSFDSSLDSLQSLYYNVVDMNGDGGLGAVTIKDEFLMEFGTEKISAVRHCNGRDWWVVTHQAGNNHFYSYLLDENGLDVIPAVSSVGDTVHFRYPKTGMIKFSHDGLLLAMTSLGKIEDGIRYNGSTELFTFDNSSGIIEQSVFIDSTSMESNYGVEFSPHDNFLYTGDLRDKIIQYDISILDQNYIANNATVIFDDVDYTVNIGALQLAPDNKIYIANILDSSLHIIHDPDKKGLTCNFEPFGLKLQNGESFLGLPNFPANVYRQEYPFISGVSEIDLCQDSIASYHASSRCTLEDYTWELIGNNQITHTTGDSTQIIATVQSRDTLVLTRTTACGEYRDSMVVYIGDCELPCELNAPQIVTSNSMIDLGNEVVMNIIDPISSLTYTWFDNDSIIGYGSEVTFGSYQLGNQTILVEACSPYCCTSSYTHLQIGECTSDNAGTLWIFGSDGIVLNFESGVPVEEDNVFFGDFITDFHSDEPSVVELDAQGNLLFYSDNDNIFNRNYEIMDNGNPLEGSQTTSQMLSLRQPGSSSIYYVFMPEPVRDFDASLDSMQSLFYNVVDMTGDGGLGTLTVKDELLMEFGTEKISAVRHCNGRDWWIVTHQAGNNHFHSYLLDEDGLDINPIISEIGDTVDFGFPKVGMIKFSHDGKLLTMTSVGLFENDILNKGKTELFTFDNFNGSIYNSIFIDSLSLQVNYSIEFSPNNKFLYVGDTRDKLIQYDISNLDSTYIKENEVVLYSYDSGNPMNIGALQLAPNNKIYVANISDSSLHIIHDPDKKGLACNFEPFGLKLQNGESFLGLSNFPANVYRQEYPIISGFNEVDLCQDSIASYYASSRCTTEDYTWELIGNNQITHTTGDSTQIIATVQSRDTLVLTRTTACGEYRDSMVVDVIDCNFECIIDFAWIEIDSMICDGESASMQYTSNAKSILINGNSYYNNSFSLDGITSDSCIMITAVFDAFCDTSFMQCFYVSHPLFYEKISFDDTICSGNITTLTFSSDADIVELFDDELNLLALGSGGSVSTPTIWSDTTFYLRLARYDGNCEEVIPLSVYIDTNVYQELDTLLICHSDTIMINDSLISLEGSYTWPLKTIDNCDSIYQLDIIHFPLSPIDSIVTHTCDPLDTMTMMTTYLNDEGCKSIRIIQTKLNTSSVTSLEAYNCDTSFAGLDTLLLTNSLGCDSLIITETFWQPFSITTLNAYECDTLFAGIDTLILDNQFGCDSLIITETSWLPPSQFVIISQICQGDTLFIENQFYTEPGSYEFVSNTNAASGCDSIISISLDFYDNQSYDLISTICAGDSVVIDGQSFTLSGEYDVLIEAGAADGCDSLISLNLNILPTTEIDTILHACSGETILFLDQSFSEQNLEGSIGIPYHSHDCDSITFHINSEYHEINLSVDIIDATCGDEYGSLVFDINDDINQLSLDGVQLDINLDSITMLEANSYTLIALDLYGCADSLDFEILSSEELTVDYPESFVLYLNEEIQIDLSTNQELSSIVWNTEIYNCESLDCSSITFTPLSEDPLTAVLTSIDGCIQYISIEIELRKVLSFPIANIFSPNGDGVNDNWVLDFTESDLIPIDVVVFDRWANKVYETNFGSRYDIRSWDGFLNTKKVVNGVYVYYFRYIYENEEQYKTGSITVFD